jgi:hypothetical protein
MKNTDPLMGAKLKSNTHLLVRGPCKSQKNRNIKYRIQVTATAKLMYIKLPMFLFFIWHLILMGENPLLHQKGWAQMALALLVAISGPKKDSFFRAQPLQWPSKWIRPHQNHYVLRHINNRYINSYFVFTMIA